MMRLNEDRRTPQGLPDLLMPYALVADGVVRNRDGSLTAAWEVRGPDLESALPQELDATTRRLNDLLKLGTGWMIHCDVVRAPVSEYPEPRPDIDPVAALIDAERRQQFASGTQFRSRYFIAVTYRTPRTKRERLYGWIEDWLIDRKATQAQNRARELEYFIRRADEFDGVLGFLFSARRLQRSGRCCELLRYIHMLITGKDHPIRIPAIPVGLNDLLSSEDFLAGTEPRIGAKHIRVIAIDGFPEASHAGILGVLDQMPIAYRWHTRAIMSDAYESAERLDDIERIWESKKTSMMQKVRNDRDGKQDLHAVEMSVDAQLALKEARSNRIQFCLYNSVVIITDEDEERLADSLQQIQSQIRNLGFGCRIENVNCVEAWIGSLPGDGYRNVRRQELHTRNLADLMATTSVWAGLEFNPSDKMPPKTPPLLYGVTTGATPFRVNLHVQDVAHTLMFGPTGAGKSTMLGLIMAQWMARYQNARVFVFDWDYSAQLITHALGGVHYDLMRQTDLAFCPLRDLESDEEGDSLGGRAWASSFIADLCRLNRCDPTPLQTNLIHNAIEELAGSPHRTITDFCAAVQDLQIREALQHYTVRGPGGKLLDATEDTLSLGGSRFVCFETRSLMESRDPRMVLPSLLYIFRRIEQRLDGSPTLIVLDEGWSYLAHDVFRRQIDTWLRTTRRRNAAVLFATQHVSDIATSPVADSVLSSVSTKILLPNSAALDPDNAKYYERIGLNQREIYMLRDANPKQHYYFMSALGRRMVEFRMGPVARALCGTNDPVSRAKALDLMARYPERWVEEWLRLRSRETTSRRDAEAWRQWADYLESQRDTEALCASA